MLSRRPTISSPPPHSWSRKAVLLVCAAFAASVTSACSHVPKEAVQLSYQIGQDLPRLHESYDALIHARFEDFKARRTAYVDDVWAPEYLSRWIVAGKLVDTAQGTLVWSFETTSFVSPSPGKEKAQLLATVHEWASVALDEIEAKRAELLEPLDRDEKALRKQVHDAFTRLIQANAYITAHLASVRNVEEQQDEVLKALSIKTLRDEIDAALMKASESAATGLDALRKADGLVDKAEKATQRLH
jgi:hypothetical protein